jgi:GGDEF domain-containing protein
LFEWDALISLIAILFHYLMNVEWSRQRALAIDEITGLPHNRLFKINLSKKLSEHTPFYLTMLNVFNSFIELNDLAYGNELIRQIGHRLNHYLPRPGSVCRLKGDEMFNKPVPENQLHTLIP